MRASEVMGIIFSNVHDSQVRELTEKRSTGSIPFGGRYRLIDFSISNLVNAGISKVGVVTEANYQSLMDHLGSGRPWDLDRKKDGLHILPPYGTSDSGVYSGHLDALLGIMNFLQKSTKKYIVLSDADLVCNLDLEPMVDAHIAKGADVTFAYIEGKKSEDTDVVTFKFDEDGRVNVMELKAAANKKGNLYVDIMVIERALLIGLVQAAAARNYRSLSRDVFQRQVKKLKLYGWQITGYLSVIDGMQSYIKANTMLLEPQVRKQLFTAERPIYTKTRDDMPAKYGLGSQVNNCIVADGCIIEGTVKNCIIFRGVKIGMGAVISDCIIMQDCVIGDNVRMDYVTADKNVRISEGRTLSGAETYPVFIRKGTVV